MSVSGVDHIHAHSAENGQSKNADTRCKWVDAWMDGGMDGRISE
jgi:hypothetical protein